MNTYIVKNDGFRFQELDLEIDDFIEYMPDSWDDITIHDFSKHNLSLKKYWKLLETGFSKIEGNENLMPDITGWIDATLVLSPMAYRFLGEAIKSYGEFLPVVIENIGEYQIFNCLSFDSSGLLYKTKDDHCYNVHCNERFKELIESFNLNGVAFEKN